MADSTKRDLVVIRAAQELVCIDCGEHFVFGRYEQEHFTRMGWPVPKRCPCCRKEEKER